MNKKIIKKYKEAFNYWLDGGKVWLKWNNIHGSKWELESHYDWKEADSCMGGEIVAVVQDDKYIEFRKALADAKIIQWKNQAMSYPIYENIEDDIDCYTLCSLRIKPDEPTFKVGDWVTRKGWQHPTVVEQVSTDRIQVLKHLAAWTLSTEFELWKPQPGEWCWFWGSHDTPFLGKFINMKETKYKMSTSSVPFTYCEPFIGTLPTHLKDN